MKILSGIDIVDVKEFRAQIENTSGGILRKLFSNDEIEVERGRKRIESIAGIFAAKEAIIKTGLVGVGEWLSIKILKSESGKPYVYILKESVEDAIDKERDKSKNKDKDKRDIERSQFTIAENIDISISHTETTAVAVAVLVS